VGKCSTIQLGLLWCEGCRGKGNHRFGFKFEMLYSYSEVTVAKSQIAWPSIFPSFSCGPLENWCGRLEGHMANLRLIHTHHAFPLRVCVVSFPFALHSAAVFDSHMPCQSPTMARICHPESDFSRPRQGRGRVAAGSRQVRGRVAVGERHSMCELASAVQRRHMGEHAENGRVAAGDRHGMCESALRNHWLRPMSRSTSTYRMPLCLLLWHCLDTCTLNSH
jgi:hypothetical protein